MQQCGVSKCTVFAAGAIHVILQDNRESKKESMTVECEEQNINIAIGHCCAGPGVTPVNPPPHVREVQSKLDLAPSTIWLLFSFKRRQLADR